MKIDDIIFDREPVEEALIEMASDKSTQEDYHENRRRQNNFFSAS